MLTNSEYISWYSDYKNKLLNSGMFGSEPKFLFFWDNLNEEWVFDPDNWNGGDILRNRVLDILDSNEQIKGVEIRYYCIDDQHTVFIFTATDWYLLTWYKSRGRTDMIMMDNRAIGLDEYINLCNMLNANVY